VTVLAGAEAGAWQTLHPCERGICGIGVRTRFSPDTPLDSRQPILDTAHTADTAQIAEDPCMTADCSAEQAAAEGKSPGPDHEFEFVTGARDG
jgi:hypothetical protein